MLVGNKIHVPYPVTNRKINLKAVQKLTKYFRLAAISVLIYVFKTWSQKSTQFRFLNHSQLIKRVNSGGGGVLYFYDLTVYI